MSLKSVEARIGRPPVDQEGKLIGEVARNPRLVKDDGFSTEAINEVFPLYEYNLSESGLEESDVERTVEGLRSSLKAKLKKATQGDRKAQKEAENRIANVIITANALPHNGNGNGNGNGGGKK